MVKVIDVNYSELRNIELKPGMIVQLQKEDDFSVHNMLIATMGGKLIAVEVYLEGERAISSKYSGNSYCFLHNNPNDLLYSLCEDTLGIEKDFGDYVVYIYPQMSPCDGEVIYRALDENHCIMIKHKH